MDDISHVQMVEAALSYARRGWPVFPCDATNKKPLTLHGFKDATTVEGGIRAFWRKWPDAMIGVAMGAKAGVWAIDLDPPRKEGDQDGREVWATVLKEHGDIPVTHTQVTPSGGTHLVFKWDPNRPVTNSPGWFAGKNIDVRGEGGYIVVAPSKCVGDGVKAVAGIYQITEQGFVFADAADWLYELVRKPTTPPPPPPKDKDDESDEAGEYDGANETSQQFWRNVNDAALRNIASWAPELFGAAGKFAANGAYRVSSKALGRANQEDLSISPEGVVDFGVHDLGDPRKGKRTPIGIVKEYGHKKDAADAALWLCARMGVAPASLGWTDVLGDVARLNKIFAVLPIGGSTRVVKFGVDDEFPGRETIVMTQTIGDFKALNDKYRHEWTDKEGKFHSVRLGKYWIDHKDRRQYDDGMVFRPNQDGDIGSRLNLWRGFGVKAIKGNCTGFLEFMRDIICGGDAAHFDYLRKREALILQRRIRSEVALGLRTKEEGCGKGFYEKTVGKLLGSHWMQVTKPVHILGKHNPHLETLLRLTADEALFVHNPEHRNGLFELITEPGITIEPKFCGVYTARNYLNTSILSNSDHFLPVSNTARRFFIPTVSTARMQDTGYFAGLQAELDAGGYEALLYHLLYEVDLTGFEVRSVPQTGELRQQRNLSLPPLEAWWCEVLESGVLWGSDPREPNRAVSNEYQREIKTSTIYGERTRSVKQPGLYDQARALEPRIRQKLYNDKNLGDFLREKAGGDNNRKVLRRVGWTFPKLNECRAKWEEKYPDWKWRNPDLTTWQPEEEHQKPVMGGDNNEPPF